MGLPSGPKNLAAQNSIKKGIPVGKLPALKSCTAAQDFELWPNKHQPKITADLVGNPGHVKKLKDCLQNWEASFLHPVRNRMKGTKRGCGSSSSKEKTVLFLVEHQG